MSEAHPGGCPGVAPPFESGHGIDLRAAQWLGLAATPTFAVMALWTGLFGGQPDMLCMAMQGSPPISGMTLMYLLMSVFHLSPWLKLIFGQRNNARGYDRAAFANPSSSMRS